MFGVVQWLSRDLPTPEQLTTIRRRSRPWSTTPAAGCSTSSSRRTAPRSRSASSRDISSTRRSRPRIGASTTTGASICGASGRAAVTQPAPHAHAPRAAARSPSSSRATCSSRTSAPSRASSRRSRSRSRSSAPTRRTRSSRCTSTRSTSARAPTASRRRPRRIFDKPVQELTLSECALLAGLPANPSLYSPRRRPGGGAARRAKVLRNMLATGAITQVEFDNAMSAPLGVTPAALQQRPRALFRRDGAPPPRRALRLERRLRRRPAGLHHARHGPAASSPSARSRSSSRRSRADLKLKNHARELRAVPAADGSARRSRTPYLQGAFVAIDPRNGYIRALVGGRDWNQSNFNRATQARAPAGLGVQAVRLHGGDRQRLPPHRHHRRRAGVVPRRRRQALPAGELRPHVPRAGDAALRAAAVDQHPGDQAAAQGGHLAGGELRAAHGHQEPARPEPLAGARQQRGHAARADVGLRRASRTAASATTRCSSSRSRTRTATCSRRTRRARSRCCPRRRPRS